MRVAGIAETLASIAITLAAGVFVVTHGLSVLGHTASPLLPTADSALEDVASQNLTIALRADELGGQNGQVAIVEFSDFQCPYCAAFARDTLPSLKRDLVDTGKIRYLFRQFPLESIHPLARAAASAAECARREGKFWPLHELLFQPQPLSTDVILQHAASVGLADTMPDCIGSDDVRTLVERDMADGRRVGVRGTPTLFVGRIQNDTVALVSRLFGERSVESISRALSAVEARAD